MFFSQNILPQVIKGRGSPENNFAETDIPLIDNEFVHFFNEKLKQNFGSPVLTEK